MRSTLLLLSLAACAAPNGSGNEQGTGAPDPSGGVPDPSGGVPADPGTGSSGAPDGLLVLDGLEPGWLVTTTTLTDAAATADTTIVSDGSPITLADAAGTRVFATITDGDGALISTQTVRAPCAPGRAHQLRVPSQYATIQAAVDVAHPGDTVAVAPGHYTESVILRPGVCLVGSGAANTVLDAQGEGRSLVDLSVAPGSVVTGFTFRGVTSDIGCADNDPLDCSGNWHPAGVFVSGEGVGAQGSTIDTWAPSQRSPALIFGNVFADNDIGVTLNYFGIGIVRNNIFIRNRNAVITSYFNDHTLVANNVFVDNRQAAIATSWAQLDIIGNILVGSPVAIRFRDVGTGAIRCNLFFANDADQRDDSPFNPHDRFVIGQDGNLDLDPRFANARTGDYHLAPGSPGIDRGCFGGHEVDGTPYDLGVYGGPLANSITL